MDRLRIAVYQRISSVAPNVHFQRQRGSATYPYVVFSFPNDVNAYRSKRPTILEIDVYDADRSGYNVAAEIEALTDAINRTLDYRTALDSGIGVKWQRIGRLAIPVPDDPNLWRRQLRYVARAWFLNS